MVGELRYIGNRLSHASIRKQMLKLDDDDDETIEKYLGEACDF